MNFGELLAGIPCPTWLTSELADLERRRRLVHQIHALSDRRTAFSALWLARGLGVSSTRKTTVVMEEVLAALVDVLEFQAGQ